MIVWHSDGFPALLLPIGAYVVTALLIRGFAGATSSGLAGWIVVPGIFPGATDVWLGALRNAGEQIAAH